MNRRNFLRRATAAATLSGLPAWEAFAAPGDYPAHPIKYIVAFTPGSANDILVRALAPALSASLGQNIVVENRPGAGGTLGMGAIAKAPGDGYTLGLGSSGAIAINRALFKDLPYDSRTDFKSVIKLASTPNLLVVPATSPVRTLDEFLRRHRAGGLKPLYSSSGNGSTQQLVAVQFNRLAGFEGEHVPYRGPAEAVAGLAGGEVDYGFVTVPSALGLVKQGRLRALGITRAAPLANLPEVPSLLNGAFADLGRTNVWFGIVVRSNTPDAILDRLHAAGTAALNDPAVLDKLVQLGYDPAPAEPRAVFQSFVQDQIAFWGDLVKASGATVS
jgi:tripartite-type tricarboxylate transporter receptor subunit TctC